MGPAFAFLPGSGGRREEKSHPSACPSDIPSMVTVPERKNKAPKPPPPTHTLRGSHSKRRGLTYFILCKSAQDRSRILREILWLTVI